MTESHLSPSALVRWGRHGLNASRGALIGIAETVPGVSGGTIALMTGVYETVLGSASHVITGMRATIADGIRGRGLTRARREFSAVNWAVIVPLLLGMVVALVIAARIMGDLIHDHPETMRGLFLGLVLASLIVPYRLAANADHPRRPEGRWGPADLLLAVIAAAATFAIVSLPRTELVASPAILIPAGAVTITALVLPGLSGSFLLLTMGLYEPTLEAVNTRDWGYLGFLALGCFIGLVSIVKILQWLLENYRRVTLVILTGVMAGSLRALWPWIDDANRTLAPHTPVAMPIVAAVIGIALVAIVIAAEKRVIDKAKELERVAIHEHEQSN